MDRDFWYETITTIKQQKWRSIATAFGVFWGIFVLTILIGCGVGFTNGLSLLFSDLPENSIIEIPAVTKMAYNGFESGRELKLSNDNIESVKKHFKDNLIDYSIINIAERSDGLPHTVTWNSNTNEYSVGGVTPSFIRQIPHKVVDGRYINDIDMKMQRKVCVIGREIQQGLFGGINPIGESIKVDNMVLTIIGVCISTNDEVSMGIDLSSSVLLPLSTQQVAYNRFDKYDIVSFVFKDNCQLSEVQAELDNLLMEELNIHPEDVNALYSVNMTDALKLVNGLSIGLNILIWIVGLGTLLAGLIGISNIMMVSIAERTQEIGVRRSLGALPSTITRQIISESLILTLTSGVLGLSMGTFALYMLNNAIQSTTEMSSQTMFAFPHMPIKIAIISLIILIIGGVIAGAIPARKALRIKAIDALRAE